jgi:membrane associated rhomboid family serine protease
MRTCAGDDISLILIVALYAACAAGLRSILERSRQTPGLRFPLATTVLVAAIAVPGTLQLLFPAMQTALQRDYTRFEGGEWWRLITPLFVQDGGLVGGVSNLVGLLVVGAIAEHLWGGWRMLVIFFGGGLVGEVVGFAWQPVGAGNSIGNFALAASVALLCVAARERRMTRAFAYISLAADGMLVAIKDLHGAAAVAGFALALVVRSRP